MENRYGFDVDDILDCYKPQDQHYSKGSVTIPGMSSAKHGDADAGVGQSCQVALVIQASTEAPL
jgi:hypothetical protein